MKDRFKRPPMPLAQLRVKEPVEQTNQAATLATAESLAQSVPPIGPSVVPSSPSNVSEAANTATADSPDGVLRRVPVNLIEDSPYQPRRKYSESSLQEMALAIKANGLQDPLLLRDMENGRYQIIGGHRRIRAARLAGLVEVPGRVRVIKDEKEAKRLTHTHNEGRENLTHYELALAYEAALDKKEGYCKTQEEVAIAFACSQGWVSKCRAMLRLPEEYRDLLDQYPDLFSAGTALEIQKLLDQHPDHKDKIFEGVKRLIDGADEKALRRWVEQAVSQKNGRTPSNESQIVRPGGDVFCLTKINKSGVLIEIKDASVSAEDVQRWIDEALKKRLEATS